MAFNSYKNSERIFDDFLRFRFPSFASRSTITEERETPLLDINLDFNRLKSATRNIESKNDNSVENISPDNEFYIRGLYELLGPRAEEFISPKNIEETMKKSIMSKLSSKSIKEFRSVEDYWNFLRTESEIKLEQKFQNKKKHIHMDEQFVDLKYSYVPSLLESHEARRRAICNQILVKSPIQHCGGDAPMDVYCKYFLSSNVIGD